MYVDIQKATEKKVFSSLQEKVNMFYMQKSIILFYIFCFIFMN